MTRYLLQQPEELESLALLKFGAWTEVHANKLMVLIREIYQQDTTDAEEVLSAQIDIIRSYLQNHMARLGVFHEALVSMGIKALSQLLKKTKSSEESRRSKTGLKFGACQTNVIVRMIETLMNKNLTYLKLTRHDMKMFGSSLFSKAHMLTGLTHLKLELSLSSPGDVVNMEADVIKVLQELGNLKYFSLNSYCTENILRCLLDNCKLIEELDLNHSNTRINDNSMNILTKIQNLKIVHLSGTTVARQGIQALLLSCKNIEHINIGGGISYVLEHIASNEEYSGEQFKLKTCTTSASLKQLQLVSRMCPLIQNCTVFKNKTLQSNLMALVGLQNLRVLKLVDYDYNTDQVKEMLEVVGSKLTHLNLDGVDNIDLIYVSQVCPYLETLSILNSTFTVATSEIELNIPPFRDLRRLSFDWSRAVSAAECSLIHSALENALLFLLSNSFQLEFIYIGPLIYVNECLILNILDKNSLDCLKELRIWQSEKKTQQITALVIDRIIQNCTSHPKVIELTRFAH